MGHIRIVLPCTLICFILIFTPLKQPAKSELALFQTSSLLFQLFLLIKCWRFFQDLNSKGLYLNSQKEKDNRFLVITSSVKREIRHFHAVVVQ